jgi:hypothetical protein
VAEVSSLTMCFGISKRPNRIGITHSPKAGR